MVLAEHVRHYVQSQATAGRIRKVAQPSEIGGPERGSTEPPVLPASSISLSVFIMKQCQKFSGVENRVVSKFLYHLTCGKTAVNGLAGVSQKWTELS